MASTIFHPSETVKYMAATTSNETKIAESSITTGQAVTDTIPKHSPCDVMAGELINSETSYLLSLPQELRDMVYRHLFDDASELHMWHPITRVSRSTRMDAARILNSKLSGYLYFRLETPSDAHKRCWWKHRFTKFSMASQFLKAVWREERRRLLGISTCWASAPEHWNEVVICCFDDFYRLQLTVEPNGPATRAVHADFYFKRNRRGVDRSKISHLFSDGYLTYKWSEGNSTVRTISCDCIRQDPYDPRKDGYTENSAHETGCACCPGNGVPSILIDKVASWPMDMAPASLPWINRAVADFYTSCRDSARQPLR